MRTVFVDTSFWVANIDRRDSLHEKALLVQASMGQCRIVTSVGVLTELLNYFSAGGQAVRRLAVEAVELLMDDPGVAVEPPSLDLFRAAVERYQARPDKTYSLTDCETMCIMDREGIDEILTADRHFEQAGYTALLR